MKYLVSSFETPQIAEKIEEIWRYQHDYIEKSYILKFWNDISTLYTTASQYYKYFHVEFIDKSRCGKVFIILIKNPVLVTM